MSTKEFAEVYKPEIDTLRTFWKETVEPKRPFVSLELVDSAFQCFWSRSFEKNLEEDTLREAFLF